MAAPDANTCAACGASGELQEHHLVPRIEGGSCLPTVMLCLTCHGLVHGRSFRANHAELTRLGLARAKARGVKLGGPNLRGGDPVAAKAGRASQSRRSKSHAADVRPFIDAARRAGCSSLREIATALTARGIHPPSGGNRWHPQQVRRILANSSV